jgi:hypothetical protein
MKFIMCWLISSKSSLTRRDKKFLEKCKDDAINKSIPIIDETDPKYFQYAEENLPIPIIQEEHKKPREKQKYSKEVNIVEYISAMSKEHEQMSKKQILFVTQKKRKKKKLQ